MHKWQQQQQKKELTHSSVIQDSLRSHHYAFITKEEIAGEGAPTSHSLTHVRTLFGGRRVVCAVLEHACYFSSSKFIMVVRAKIRSRPSDRRERTATVGGARFREKEEEDERTRFGQSRWRSLRREHIFDSAGHACRLGSREQFVWLNCMEKVLS